MKAYVFPGQGSQKKGMGADLFDLFPEETAKADQILGYSIKTLCVEDPEKKLGLTQYTQPALYVVNALTYLKKLQEEPKPDFVAGHSLGEYNALFAAGAYSFATGLELVKRRGELMGQAKGGGMAAVVGLDMEKVKELLAAHKADDVDVANFNSPTQTVISGPTDFLETLVKPFEEAGARRCMILKVSAAFHSRYMEPAAVEFAEFLKNYRFNPLEIPVIANITARPYKSDEITANLAGQIRGSVQWTDSMRYLMGKGVETAEEVGPGRVLGNLWKAINRDAEPLVVDETPAAAAPATATAPVSGGAITAETLGSAAFRKDYGIKYAYVAGSMYKGIGSKELVVRMGKAGLIGFLGSGGLRLDVIEDAIKFIQRELSDGQAYGMNLLNNLENPQLEQETVELFLRYGVQNVEASAYMRVSAPLVHFRFKGSYRDANGVARCRNRVIAKVSRPEVSASFMQPPPQKMVDKLVAEGKLTADEAAIAATLPTGCDVCIEADSGGHTDMGVAYTLMPAICKQRDDIMAQYKYPEHIRIGAAGGIGAPASAAAAFLLGAEFVLTGSINQCSPEAGTSDRVKEMLSTINVQDTEYAPAGDMFELGARVQVLKKGLFFPARANKLYDLWRQHNSLDEIDEKTKKTIQEKYFKRSFDEVWTETRDYYNRSRPQEVQKAERNPKHKMAMIFKWYFVHSTRLAMKGSEEQKVDYQVHCGPAMGAFNQYVKGTDLEEWRKRHVDVIAERMMRGTAELLSRRFAQFTQGG